MFSSTSPKSSSSFEGIRKPADSAVAFERSPDYVPVRHMRWRRFRSILERFPCMSLEEQLQALRDECSDAPPGGRLWLLLNNGCNVQMVMETTGYSVGIRFGEDHGAQYTGQKASLSLNVDSSNGTGTLVWVQNGKELSGKVMMGLFLLLSERLAVTRWTLNDVAALKLKEGNLRVPLRLYRCLSKGNSWFGRFGFRPKSHTPGQPSAASFWSSVERLQAASAPAGYRMTLGQTFQSMTDLSNPKTAQMLSEVLLDLQYRKDLKADLDRVVQTKLWEYQPAPPLADDFSSSYSSLAVSMSESSDEAMTC